MRRHSRTMLPPLNLGDCSPRIICWRTYPAPPCRSWAVIFPFHCLEGAVRSPWVLIQFTRLQKRRLMSSSLKATHCPRMKTTTWPALLRSLRGWTDRRLSIQPFMKWLTRLRRLNHWANTVDLKSWTCRQFGKQCLFLAWQLASLVILSNGRHLNRFHYDRKLIGCLCAFNHITFSWFLRWS